MPFVREKRRSSTWLRSGSEHPSILSAKKALEAPNPSITWRTSSQLTVHGDGPAACVALVAGEVSASKSAEVAPTMTSGRHTIMKEHSVAAFSRAIAFIQLGSAHGRQEVGRYSTGCSYVARGTDVDFRFSRAIVAA